MAIERVKRILDTVHGYVQIPDVYVKEIIDTPEFQRLRRIEQTSCRALFPSARHDRFIHSIGVFHIGTLISDHLWAQACGSNERKEGGAFPTNEYTASIIATYRLACLLHDVGHTPFSHTFEKFFNNDQNELLGTLTNLLLPEDPDFYHDFTTPMPGGKKNKLTPHEFLSAIIAIERFGHIIVKKYHVWKEFEKCGGDKALLARMIVGCPYSNPNKSLENAFIDLIHGFVIDADGLDYACRDVWASGYSTSKVDISRLIEAIRIYNDNGKYVVCFDAKAINEILSVLQVKSFQSEYVFSHHSVIFEQKLLVEAMKSAAFQLEVPYGQRISTDRETALQYLCDIDLFRAKGHSTRNGQYFIRYVMDDDFVSLMKMFPDDKYVNQWFSRKYDFVPIWKTREAFMSDLPEDIINNDSIGEAFWLYSDDCLQFLKERYGINDDEVMVLDVDFDNRNSRICSIYLYVNRSIHPFSDYYKDIDDEKFKKSVTFKYIYIPKRVLNEHIQLGDIRHSLMAECKKYYSHYK